MSRGSRQIIVTSLPKRVNDEVVPALTPQRMDGPATCPQCLVAILLWQDKVLRLSERSAILDDL